MTKRLTLLIPAKLESESLPIFLDELDKYNKSYKFVELDGADHFYNTLDYGHQLTLYTSMIDYLKNDCGPGGL